jgi:DHA1 family tetracycline resistance protein-like MFS transporter
MNELPMAENGGRRNDKFLTTPLIIIFFTVFIDLVGFGIVIPILPFYAAKEPFGANPFQIGLLTAVYSLMQFFFSPILGRMSDTYGRRPILFISLLGSVIGYLVLGFANTLFLVFLGRVISGITGANISAAQAYIADITTKENRAKGMGLFGAAFGLGFILGPALAGILSKYGVHVPFFVAGGLSLLSAAGVFFLLPESRKQKHHMPEEKGRLGAMIDSLRDRDFGLANLQYFLLITAFSIMTYAFVLYLAYRFDYNPEQVGYLFAFVGAISIVGQGVLFAKFVRIFGETRVAAAGSLLMVISLFAIPVVGPDAGGLTGLLAVCVVMSFGNALASPALTSLISKISHEHKQGSSLGIMQSGASLARALGPTLGGILLNNALNKIDDGSLYRTFWTASAIMLIAFFIAVYCVKVIVLDRDMMERVN